MYTLTYWNDLANWKRIAESCFGYGNHITSSRFHALKKMVDWRLEYIGGDSFRRGMMTDENLQTMQALSRICDFAGERATKGEQQIYLHLFIDICTEELAKEPKEPSRKWDDDDDDKDFDEPYPPEDSADYISDVPF